MKSNQGLPLLVVEFVGWVVLGTLGVVDLDTLAFHHNQAGIDPLNFSNQLLLGDGSGLGLLDDLGRLILYKS